MRPASATARAACLAAPLLLGGCKLVDQTTFAPAPVPPARAQLAVAKTPARVPLATVHLPDPAADYRGPLGYAVTQAEAVKPDVAFDVVTVLSGKGTPIEQERAAKQGRADAVAVMEALQKQGVPASRIRLGGEIDPAVSERTVRVYVR